MFFEHCVPAPLHPEVVHSVSVVSTLTFSLTSKNLLLLPSPSLPCFFHPFHSLSFDMFLRYLSLWISPKVSLSSLSPTHFASFLSLLLLLLLLLFSGSPSHLTPISCCPGCRISLVTETGCSLIVLFQRFFAVKSHTALLCLCLYQKVELVH